MRNAKFRGYDFLNDFRQIISWPTFAGIEKKYFLSQLIARFSAIASAIGAQAIRVARELTIVAELSVIVDDLRLSAVGYNMRVKHVIGLPAKESYLPIICRT